MPGTSRLTITTQPSKSGCGSINTINTPVALRKKRKPRIPLNHAARFDRVRVRTDQAKVAVRKTAIAPDRTV